MTEDYRLAFKDFLNDVEQKEFDINTTAAGASIIQQSQRNLLRREGITAFKKDLEWLYGDAFDIVETKDGIVIVAENKPGDFTFSWEIKTTIKSVDYDPFLEADTYDQDRQVKAEKKLARQKEKENKEHQLMKKRAKKLAELEAKKNRGE